MIFVEFKFSEIFMKFYYYKYKKINNINDNILNKIGL